MNNSITLRLESAGRSPDLADFSKVCAALKTCLGHVSRVIARKDVGFEIADLANNGRLLAVRPSANGTPAEVLADIQSTFLSTIDAIQRGTPVDPRLDADAVRAFSDFSEPINRGGLSLSIGDTTLTKEYSDNVNALLNPTMSAKGSVSGVLKALPDHDAERFALYPPVHGEEVTCRFSRLDLSEVLKAVQHHVTVYGTLHYADNKAFPVCVDVDSFDVEPDDETLPTLLDARGALCGNSGISGAARNDW